MEQNTSLHPMAGAVPESSTASSPRRVRGSLRELGITTLLLLAMAVAASAADNLEPNDSPGQATGLSSGIEVASWLSTAGDADWFTFSTVRNGTITASLRSLPKDYDLTLYFLNPGTGEIEEQEGWTSQNSGTADESILAAPEVTGTFFLQVYAFGGIFDAGDSYILSVVYPGDAPDEGPTVSVLDPNGGETLQAGTNVAISYTATDPDTPSGNLLIDIEYSANAGTAWTSVATSVANTGTYSWTVPTQETTLGRIRVSASDGQSVGFDASDQNFSIVPPPAGANSIEIGRRTGPSGGQVSVPVSLVNGDAVTTIDLTIQFDPLVASYVSANGTGRAAGIGVVAIPIQPGTMQFYLSVPGGGAIPPGTGSCIDLAFTLIGAGGAQTPLTPTAHALTGVNGVALTATVGAGGLSVAALAPVVTVVSPNGGEVFTGGEVTIVNYAATDTDTPAQNLLIDLDYSDDGGQHWQAIAVSQPNATHFAWTPPAVPTERGRIRVSARDGINMTSDASDGNFSVRLPEPNMNLLVAGIGSGFQGEIVTILLSLANEDAVSALATDLVYDPAIVAYEGGASSERGAGMAYADSTLDSSTVRLSLTHVHGISLQPGSGAIASLRFRLVAPAVAVSPISLESPSILGSAGEPLRVATEPGSIAVEERPDLPPVVTLVGPNGGESLTAGDSAPITYVATDPDTPSDSLRIDLDYSVDGGTTWTPIASSQPNASQFLWTVPAVPTSHGRIRVVASDGTNQSADVSSADFQILPPAQGTNVLAAGSAVGTPGSEVSIALGLSNGDPVHEVRCEIVFDAAVVTYLRGEVAGRGAAMLLESSEPAPNRLALRLTMPDSTSLSAGTGAIARLVFGLVGDAGAESPLTPNATTLRNAQGRSLPVISEAGRIEVSGTETLPPSIAILSPNGSETLTAGTQAAITYAATDPDTPAGSLLIDIDVSVDGGGTWSTIAASLPNDGIHSWSVPSLETTRARVRVAASDGAHRVADLSDGDFTITLPASGDNILTIGTESSVPGERINVAVALTNEDPVTRVSADIVFDPAVARYVGGTPAGRGVGFVYDGRIAGSNRLLLDLSQEDPSELPAGDGVIAVLTFDLVGTAGTTTALDPAAATLLGQGGRTLSLATAPGVIRLVDPEQAPPVLTVGVLKNPARTRDIQIFVRSDRRLDQLTVTVGSNPLPMRLIDPATNLHLGVARISSADASAIVQAIGMAGSRTGSAQSQINF